MIYLHTDARYRPDQWYRRFEYLLQQRQLAYRKVNLLRKDYRKLKINVGDALIGRFGHAKWDLARMKPIYDELAAEFAGRVFPAANTYSYYDDKRAQLELFEAHGYPAPRAATVTTPEDVERFLEQTGLCFPLVTKKFGGAGSTNVRLANGCDDVFYPGVVQEYCANNDRDLRLNVIGDRVMGYWRLNRPNDFRASGSGRLLYTDRFDDESIELVHRISREQGFESMAYDLVRDATGRWVVLEISYSYVDTFVRDCPYYYDARSGEWIAKEGVYPQDYIFEDFLARHPVVEANARRERKRGWRSIWQHRQMHRPSCAGDGQVPYEMNEEAGAINVELKLERQRRGEVFEWPNIVELNKLAAQYSQDKKVLDVGCGTGCAAQAMSAGAREVVAIEPDTATLDWAQENRAAENILYLNKLSGELDYRDYFDLVTNIDVIEHVRDYRGLIEDVVRMLKPGGRLLLTTPNRLRDNPPKLRPVYPYHVQEFSPSDLYFILNMYFDEVRLMSLRNVYDYRTTYPIDLNSRATPVIVLATNPRKSTQSRPSGEVHARTAAREGQPVTSNPPSELPLKNSA